MNALKLVYKNTVSVSIRIYILIMKLRIFGIADFKWNLYSKLGCEKQMAKKKFRQLELAFCCFNFRREFVAFVNFNELVC